MCYHSPRFQTLRLILLPESLVFTKTLNNCGCTERMSNNRYFIPVDGVLCEKA